MRSLLIHDIKIMRLIMNYLINITLNHAVSNLELKIRVRVGTMPILWTRSQSRTVMTLILSKLCAS